MGMGMEECEDDEEEDAADIEEEGAVVLLLEAGGVGRAWGSFQVDSLV